MSNLQHTKWLRVLLLLAGVLIVKVTLAVVWGYRNYFPPDFNADFLRGRADYFFGWYCWAFYVHIASGPVAMISGMILISDSFRRRFPRRHRKLGRIQVVVILLLVAPSGFGMAIYATAGPVGAAGFFGLSVFTAAFAALGWRAAIQRRFDDHHLWMWRTFLLLCSAVILRIMGGMAVVLGLHAQWFDPAAAWLCWLLPLIAFEVVSLGRLSRINVTDR